MDDQKPRLLTLQQAKIYSGIGFEEVWFDADEEEGTGEYKRLFSCAFINGHILCADGDIGQVDEETYNRPRNSRLWMGAILPTEAEREAAPWDGT